MAPLISLKATLLLGLLSYHLQLIDAFLPLPRKILSTNGRANDLKQHLHQNNADQLGSNSSAEPKKGKFPPNNISRRVLLGTIAAGTLSSTTPSCIALEPSSSPTKTHLSTQWTATMGLNSLSSNEKFVSFDASAYKAMTNDPARTPYFEKAIRSRLLSHPGGPSAATVLDLGTGPFALFALLAARAGAGKVYAIEANPDAARAARETVARFGMGDVVTILEGFSTEISLPQNQKADFCIAEIVGSVASEEGAYASIQDAWERLVKDPQKDDNWIPSRVQTYAAPAAYTLHNLFQPPAFDWDKLKGEPVRFNCRDEGLQLLADPILVEDISFARINEMKPRNRQEIKFIFDAERIEDNIYAFYEEYKRAKLDKKEAETLAQTTGTSFSGVAFWPRLILDGDGVIQVNSRSYPDGGHQRSHWQTVLPIMNDTPIPVKAGDELVLDVDFDLSGDVARPPCYKLDGDIYQNMA